MICLKQLTSQFQPQQTVCRGVPKIWVSAINLVHLVHAHSVLRSIHLGNTVQLVNNEVVSFKVLDPAVRWGIHVKYPLLI